ncbi:hypothetical protein I6N95_17475 [Vagococcus sp. BWB3-3]|uniref:Uncharacterized protein n=1 Tax=Vagococcus allomyrinae TaxID=2794353 RepID=A0A940SVZ7_9ENTE|nr:hypothetical protein [Vagococcus allomyrinae]MBP1042810.1 hypothetical protein [Vagococcus allomyrinae]
MTELVKEVAEELKQTMLEMTVIFKGELTEKNRQIMMLEEALRAQQSLTIQANERLNQLEQGKKMTKKEKKSSKRPV